jgi:putative flippase GtrA
VRFLIIGGGANFAYFAGTYLLVTGSVAPFVASALSWSLAFAAAYLLQRGWTFSGQHPHGQAFPRYLIAQIGCGGVVALGTQAAAVIWRPTHLQISIGSALLSGALSYVASLTWVFRSAAPPSAKPKALV